MTRTISTPEELRALPPRSVVFARWPEQHAHDFTVIRSSSDAGRAATGSYGIHGTREWLQMAEWVAELTVLHDASAPSVPAPGAGDREALAQALFDWNTPTDPYFVVHGRSGEVSDGDCYLPIADAILTAGFRRLTVTPEMIEAGRQALHDFYAAGGNVGNGLAARVVLEAALGDTK